MATFPPAKRTSIRFGHAPKPADKLRTEEFPRELKARDPAIPREQTALLEPWLLRPKQAAQLLTISRSRIYELMADGSLPSIKIGRSRRIRVDDLRRWLDDQGD